MTRLAGCWQRPKSIRSIDRVRPTRFYARRLPLLIRSRTARGELQLALELVILSAVEGFLQS